MLLTETTVIKKSHPFFKECDDLSFKAKNVYNSAIYKIRHSEKYLNYNATNRLFIDEKNPDYQALPRKVSNGVLIMVDRNYKSFFE
jgi:putative transposase